MSKPIRVRGACCDFAVTLILLAIYFAILCAVITRQYAANGDDDNGASQNYTSNDGSYESSTSYDGPNNESVDISFTYAAKAVESRNVLSRDDANRKALREIGATVLNVHKEACEFFNGCELVRFVLEFVDNANNSKDALARIFDPAFGSSSQPRAWTNEDVTRWNAQFLRSNASISLRAPLSYVSNTLSAYYIYTETNSRRFSVATVQADTSNHVTRGYVSNATGSALQIKLVPDDPPSRVLKASPFWSSTIPDIHAHDDRIVWSVSVRSTNSIDDQGFKLGGRVRIDEALVITFATLNDSHVELNIYDTFGYGMCAPMESRYLPASHEQDGFALAPHPHHGFYSIASHGVIIASGAAFTESAQLTSPMRTSVRVDIDLPFTSKAQSPNCQVNASAVKHVSNLPGKTVDRMERVVGGDVVKLRGEYPFMVSVQRAYDDKENAPHAHVCGGSLIAPNVVLTAAHCIGRIETEWLGETNCFTDAHHVDVGRISLSDESEMKCVEEIPIADVIIHPAFNEKDLSYDFALIKLVADSSYAPIEVYDPANEALEGVDAHNQIMHSVGWGHTAYRGHLSDDLMVMNTFIYDRDRCKLNYDNVILEDGKKAKVVGVLFGEHNLCAYHKVGNTVIDNCQGDSGGPLFFEHRGLPYLMGIVSFGYECAYRHSVVPGVYANATHVLDWIRAHVVAADWF
ncbi:hypothetical protein CYMTET_35735 [Cymbomonas tetramitiformis]|uniref:Peptidase S1 domain-containing protein n=1 Tax=Cymbomonas tetramitiformis TaxID=36881 RepID=A0AAE0KNL0_9CHLO|nr:hypothetical protein CYMTET_35735 [Cymbomonas tetramitiformis]|eukprot:gene182-318_t